MKTVFILNPRSGRDQQYEWMNQIKKNFKGRRIIIEKTKQPGHATLLAQKYAFQNEPVHIFVCGGDGTLHEVINGIANKENVYVSIVPLGTGNDFIRSLGYTREELMDLSGYEKPIEKKVDLLKIGSEYAINMISFGFDVHVAKEANAMRKIIKVEGKAPYYLGMLKSLSKRLTDDYRLRIDDKQYPVEEYSFLVFANGQYYGGGYQPCPQADVSDGIMDVCRIGNVKRHQILRLAKAYEKGEHIKYTDLVSVSKAHVVWLDTQNKSIDANLDGEVRSFKNPTIEVENKAVTLLLPSKNAD